MSRIRASRLSLLMLLVTCLLLVVGQAAPEAAMQESGKVEPIVVLDEAGVEVSIIGSTTMQPREAAGAYLTLERLSIEEGATLGPMTPVSPDLIVIERGALQEQDERGFWKRMEAPYQIPLEPGVAVTWSATQATSLLRLRLTEAGPDDAAFNGIEVERVAQFRLDALPEDIVHMFIAEASISSQSGGARLEHDGSLGIVVESGALDLVSPSGLEGTLGEGQSALYPDGAPIGILGSSDNSSAEALLVGVSASDRPIEASVAIACQNGESPCIELV